MKPFIIGIAGGTGAGKTTVANMLTDHFKKRILLLSHDRYYKDQSHLSMEERKETNYDHPNALETSLMIQHLEKLMQGESVDVPVYDFTEHNRSQKTDRLDSKPIILVEGILVLSDKKLRELFDLKVYVFCSADMRLGRRIKRDVLERGRTFDFAISQYFNLTREMHNKYVEPVEAIADIIIPWERYNHSAVQTLIDMIELKLQQKGT